VTEDDVRDFVEQGPVRHRGQRGHGNLLAAGESPHVAVNVVEGDLLDAESL
jgi:hypothetical protein